VAIVEAHPADVVLLAMAGLELESRRLLADAMVASVRIRPPVTGGDLVDAGIEPGRRIGEALRMTRDALVDGEINDDQAREYAIETARSGVAEQLPERARR
jgi:hypothetical protein